MAEIVVAEPSYEVNSNYTGDNTRSLAVGCSHDHDPEPFESERLPPTLAADIQIFLRVANSVDKLEPRIAYLCRFRAFEIAHQRDRNSTGRGVRQFKTSLLARLQKDEEFSIRKRKEKSDIRELKRVYKYYCDSRNRERLTDVQNISAVLHEVLETATNTDGLQVVADRPSIHANIVFNILPLEHGGIDQPIMQINEIKEALAAIRIIPHLAQDVQKYERVRDLFDLLQSWFGFQKDNAANQKEHLVLLLANKYGRQIRDQTSNSRLRGGAVDELMRKFFKNYTDWCKFLGRKSNIRLPWEKPKDQFFKLSYIGLYLLIWGEAANLRFMPECLCYIFHHMAYELHGKLTDATDATTWEKIMPAYGGQSDSFLDNVVTPIYRVIREEAKKSNNGTADHSSWRNYDDLNEYFWSPSCFEIGWPMRLDHDFFCVQPPKKPRAKNSPVSHIPLEQRRREGDNDIELGATGEEVHESKWLGKTNFIEIRSFWQIFRSFDRMWSFFLLSLQAMIIMACHDLGSPFQLFNMVIFEDIMSIFITSAILQLIQAILDIAFTWKARSIMAFSQKRKLVMKMVIAVIWTIILPICYAKSRGKYSCYSAKYGSWLAELCFSSYVVAVAIYMVTNAVDMVLFLVPAVGKYIETSNCRIWTVLSWWTRPRIYVGRGMQEDQVSIFKYTFFWILVLLSKFLFSYFFEIKPLIAPTKQIMKIGVKNYEWHELFPKVKSNAGAIVAVWAPIIVVYFMDTQIWYSVFCTIFGGLYGILHHLGEIRTLGMLRSRFYTLPLAFNFCLISPSSRNVQKKRKGLFQNRFHKALENEKIGVSRFAFVWNQIVKQFRLEDLISNRELDLMTIPMSSEIFPGMIRWPVFLLADKFSTALSIAKDFEGKDEALFRKIKKDKCMYYAVRECYESLKYTLQILVEGNLETRIISAIVDEIEESIERSSLLQDIKMKELPALVEKCISLVELLVEGNQDHRYKVVKALQDIFELLTSDMLINGSRILGLLYPAQRIDTDVAEFKERPLFSTSTDKDSIKFPLPDSDPLNEQIKRFHLLLTVKDSAMDVPANLEARRRISFFATSLFMDMPSAPKVENMLSFSVITPHYMEDVNYSMEELQSSKQGVSILYYMKKIFPDECKNFIERMGGENLDELEKEGKENELRDWASFRGQTLSRTVRGMMYYREALKLQAFLDEAEEKDILGGYDKVEKENPTLSAELNALADMKFTYVISCQSFGSQKASGNPHASDIIDLMKRYPSLRVAYVEEKEDIDGDKPQKVYSSLLTKAVNGLEQAIYRIRLPGTPDIGEGKPENQNHAIIFTRGEALQAIDMNQDNYLEEALKIRNLLQEFRQHHGRRHPTILGLREHIFTGSVSSLAWFMSYQETSFVTIGQRLLASPLRVRFHYGHPDVFDRIFHITRGGISKASKTINLSEDVFAGFNSTLRRGCITYHEYMQVGKGRDVGLNQISRFEAKVANGNSEQTISRDIHRLGRQFDFFRMLSCYFTTIGFYFSSLISVIGIYVFLYGQLYLVLSGLEKALLIEARVQNIQSLETALASQSFIQLGLLTGLPMVMEIGLEKGFLTALKDFVLMQLQLAAVFFTFSLGTKIHYYGRTILHGGAKYRPTGRKIVVFHATFTENYRLYSRSHFVKGFELLLLLIVYDLFRRSYQSSMAYVLITYSIWFMSITWLFAPFLFNPSGFSWGKIVDDWKDWNKWIRQQGGIGVHQDKSWQSWWDDEQAHLRQSGLRSRLIEILLSLRFFIYQYGLVYHLDISKQSKNFLVYVLSWVVILVIFLLAKAVNLGRQLLSTNHHLWFRLFKTVLFLGVLSIIVTLSIICDLSFMDLIVCCLGFIPTGWGLIQISQAMRPKIENSGLWYFIRVLAKAYDYGMGVVLFAPIAVLAWLPIISAFQTRFLFNEAFNRHLQIQPILAGKRKQK